MTLTALAFVTLALASIASAHNGQVLAKISTSQVK